jgi:hypothetical protein
MGSLLPNYERLSTFGVEQRAMLVKSGSGFWNSIQATLFEKTTLRVADTRSAASGIIDLPVKMPRTPGNFFF